jgi:hypothetical protein
MMNRIKSEQSKTIPVTGREGLWVCVIFRIPHFLYNWLTDGSKVVSLTHRPYFTLQKHFFLFLVLISVSG